MVNQWYHLVIISVFYKNGKWSCSVLNLCIIQSCTTTITVCRGQLLLEKNPGVLNIRKRHSCCLFIFFSIILRGILAISGHVSFISFIFILNAQVTMHQPSSKNTIHEQSGWLHLWCYIGLLLSLKLTDAILVCFYHWN